MSNTLSEELQQLTTEYYQDPVMNLDLLKKIENVRQQLETSFMKTVTIPISKHVKQLLISMYGHEPVDISRVVSESDLRKFKLSVDRPEPTKEDRHRTTLQLSYPESMMDVFYFNRYFYQVEEYFNGLFEVEMIKHVTILKRGGGKVVNSIIDFFQAHQIDEASLDIDNLRQIWYRHQEKLKVKSKKVKV
jgi:hypothetical protein